MEEKEIDQSFDLPYTRLPHPKYKKRGAIPAYDMIKFSINMHRGCFGGCSFCTISAHQGKFIASRSEKSILKELDEVSNNLESTTLSPVATGNPLANRAKKLKIKSPTLGEAVVKFLTIGQLAEAIGIAVATCRKWERMNILPPSNYRNEGGHRLYSIDQAQIVTDIYHKHLNKFADRCEKWRLTEDFQKEIFETWQSLHMGVNPNRFKHTDLSKLNDALEQ